ncbi:MAG: hypothetical protein DRI57_03075 [Deltaproteobacteria bacterium]|nr:MAG: hypothetical protein DRI57_03075 [Deltaproteobacteria bacterium]
MNLILTFTEITINLTVVEWVLKSFESTDSVNEGITESPSVLGCVHNAFENTDSTNHYLFFLEVGKLWADENVTNRVANCDPVFVPPIFFNLKISRLQSSRNKNGISFLRASTTDSSPQINPDFFLPLPLPDLHPFYCGGRYPAFHGAGLVFIIAGNVVQKFGTGD